MRIQPLFVLLSLVCLSWAFPIVQETNSVPSKLQLRATSAETTIRTSKNKLDPEWIFCLEIEGEKWQLPSAQKTVDLFGNNGESFKARINNVLGGKHYGSIVGWTFTWSRNGDGVGDSIKAKVDILKVSPGASWGPAQNALVTSIRELQPDSAVTVEPTAA